MADSFPPFKYIHFGNTAYIGDENAVYELNESIMASGVAAIWLWRSIYLSEQVSLRTRIFVALDWLLSAIFGRNIGEY